MYSATLSLPEGREIQLAAYLFRSTLRFSAHLVQGNRVIAAHINSYTWNKDKLAEHIADFTGDCETIFGYEALYLFDPIALAKAALGITGERLVEAAARERRVDEAMQLRDRLVLQTLSS